MCNIYVQVCRWDDSSRRRVLDGEWVIDPEEVGLPERYLTLACYADGGTWFGEGLHSDDPYRPFAHSLTLRLDGTRLLAIHFTLDFRGGTGDAAAARLVAGLKAHDDALRSYLGSGSVRVLDDVKRAIADLCFRLAQDDILDLVRNNMDPSTGLATLVETPNTIQCGCEVIAEGSNDLRDYQRALSA